MNEWNFASVMSLPLPSFLSFSTSFALNSLLSLSKKTGLNCSVVIVPVVAVYPAAPLPAKVYLRPNFSKSICFPTLFPSRITSETITPSPFDELICFAISSFISKV